jgi:hypothetical protein
MKYHVNPYTGDTGLCSARPGRCPYAADSEHYPTEAAARRAYESLQTMPFTFIPPVPNSAEYSFTLESDYYGIPFKAPDMKTLYLEDNRESGSMFYRFEQLEEIFNDFHARDVQPGYSMNADFSTLQKFVSPKVVQEYMKLKNPFLKNLYSERPDEEVTYPTVLVKNNELYICDGNHRFCAAKLKGSTSFAGIVVEMSDDEESYRVLSPEEFNERFSHGDSSVKFAAPDEREILKSRALKSLDFHQIRKSILYEARDSGLDSQKIEKALNLAEELHSGQKRESRGEHEVTPYVEHPYRNTLRLMRMGVRDESVINASLLHDTVEDCSEKFAKSLKFKSLPEAESRALLLDHIKENFGEETADIVLGVTNDIQTKREKYLPKAEKDKLYRAHVQKEISRNPKVYLVKYADFIDNAAGLYHNVTKERPQDKRARKYLPVVEDFENNIESTANLLPKETQYEMRVILSRTRESLKKIIQDSGS